MNSPYESSHETFTLPFLFCNVVYTIGAFIGLPDSYTIWFYIGQIVPTELHKDGSTHHFVIFYFNC